MTLLSFTNQFLGLGTIIADIFVAFSVAYVLLLRKTYPRFGDFFAVYGLWFAFGSAITATTFSLFYSQIAGFPPCNLCWLQRLFMYPLVILLLVAIVKKSRKIADYALVVAGVGLAVSLYHNYIYYYNQGLIANCELFGAGVSCLKRYVFEFGYVTIPVMSLTAFALIIIFLVFYRSSNHDSY